MSTNIVSYISMEPSLHAHIIGFPYQANSVKNNYSNDSSSGGGGEEKKKQDIKARQKAHLASIYKPLYELSNKYLENGYSILYIAESLPSERDKAKVIENIQNANNDNNYNNAEQIQKNISKGLLTVIDSNTEYKHNASGRDIVDFLLSNLYEMQRRTQLQEKTKGTMIFNSPDSFFNRGKYDIFMDFEEEVGKRLPQDVGLLCWYKRKWLNNLSLSHIISVLAHHKHTIHSNWEYKQWDTNKIIDVISKGIDNNLGEGSSILLFHTLRSAYKLKQDAIVDRPDVFEERLKRVLGKDDANSVINSIFEEIIRQVEFGLV